MTLRTTLMAAAGLLAIGSAPAFAQGGGSGGDSNINSFVNQQPGTPPVSNGVPVIVDNRDGQPVIRYQGARRGVGGMEDGRTPHIVGNRDGGQPVIRYGAGGPPPPVRGRGNARNPGAAVTAESQVIALLSRANTALRQGQFAAAAASLEQAETNLLNARPADGSNVDNAALSAIGQARAAANRRDRNTALRALGTAQTQITTSQG